MSNAYTCEIPKGISFPDFALRCAREFGALIEMRDEPLDAPIKKMEPGSYHMDVVKSHEKDIAAILSLSEEECDKKVENEYSDSLTAWYKHREYQGDLRGKLQGMLDKVNAWVPPTSEHTGLKEFMVEQIVSAIQFDCPESEDVEKEPVRPTGAQWRESVCRQLAESIEYHKKSYAREVARVAERNAWVQALRESLT